MRKKVQLDLEQAATAVEALAEAAGLSKSAVRKAMSAGAVWTLEKGRRVRLRRASRQLPAGTRLWLFYDDELLARKAPAARCLRREKGWSVWFKPPGLLTQGNEWGDHLSLLRQAEKHLGRPVWLVHRLDRETAGLVLLAHHRQAAAWLSEQFRQRRVDKGYRAWVHGRLQGAGVIDAPLDGRPALTRWQALDACPQRGWTRVDIELETGRLHQIRRHFARLGHPVVGGPRYGRGDGVPLQLVAWRLGFTPARGHEQVVLALDEADWRESGFLACE